MNFSRITLFAALWMGFWFSSVSAAPQTNRSAQNLSRLLGPSRLNAKSGSAEDINAIRARAIPILNYLEKSSVSSGPPPESLVENAYDLRKDVGPYEKIITGQMLIKAWKDARGMGLFENGNFSVRISGGRFAGKSVVFEHIVPAEVYPAGSTHLANFRIVAPERKRQDGAAMTPREEAFQGQLARVMTEIERGKELVAIQTKVPVNAVGQTKQEAKLRWEREVEEAGDLAQQMPSMNIEGRVTATPSHKSGYRWRISSEIQNRSGFPTEVELEYWIVGITDKKRDHYLMAKGTQKHQLRKGEEVELEFFTKSSGSYKQKADDHDELSKEERKRSRVRMRGIVIRVNHAKGVAATFASDKHLLGYVDDEDPMSIGSVPAY